MYNLDKIAEKLRYGAEISYEEYQSLIAQQEAIDDALEVLRGNIIGARSEQFKLRAVGAGLAIVVGHTQSAQGAYGGSPINQHEYPWNKHLAAQIKATCTTIGVTSKIFYRDNIGIEGAYQQVATWGAKCVMELHFNAYNSSAKGTETLYDNNRNAGSRAWAQRLQNTMLEVLGTNDRGLKECDPGDRGYGSVSAVNIPSALIEPFFGDNPSDAAKGHNNKEDLAEALAKAAAQQLGIA